jgi:hypothetical protein
MRWLIDSDILIEAERQPPDVATRLSAVLDERA